MTITNLIVRNCKSDYPTIVPAIVLIDTCSNDTENVFRITVQNTSFVENEVTGGPFVFDVQDPDCYELFLEDVLFSSNIGYRSATMAKTNSLVRVRLENNSMSSPSSYVDGTATFYLDEGSKTTIQGMTATFNTDLKFEFRNASLSMTDSLIGKCINGRIAFIEAYDSKIDVNGSEFRSNHNALRKYTPGIFSFKKASLILSIHVSLTTPVRSTEVLYA